MCYHPMKAFDTGFLTDNGKPLYKICSYDTPFIHKPKSKDVAQSQKLQNVWTDWKIYDFVEIPCGKCIECRFAYAREWANRCMLEMKNYKDNEFITLTYDDKHLPTKSGVDLETGELTTIGYLKDTDLTKFMKDLRRYYKYHFNHEGIRFYACGEYGDLHKRPHFHLIVFNLPVQDKKFAFTNKKGNVNYHSEIIQKIWGKGLTSLAEVNWNTCAYTARYIVKKQKGKGSAEWYAKRGLTSEFVRMSRRPGIAHQYYEENKKEIYKTDEMFLKERNGEVKAIKPAKYYDKLFDLENPERMKQIKKIRKEFAENVLKIQLEKTDLNLEEYREMKEKQKEEQAKKLIRILEKTG